MHKGCNENVACSGFNIPIPIFWFPFHFFLVVLEYFLFFFRFTYLVSLCGRKIIIIIRVLDWHAFILKIYFIIFFIRWIRLAVRAWAMMIKDMEYEII